MVSITNGIRLTYNLSTGDVTIVLSFCVVAILKTSLDQGVFKTLPVKSKVKLNG